MEQLIKHFPTQLNESIAIAMEQKIALKRPFSNLVICGLGGSGIGGEIIKQWLMPLAKIPVFVCHNYHLPAFVNDDTLVVACSYSGNTEETLTALKEAIALKTQVIGITSGGRVKELGNAFNFPVILIPGGLPPRAALAYPLVQLAGLMDHLKISDGLLLSAISSASLLLEQEQLEIKKIAIDLLALSEDKQLLFYAEEQFYPATLRACQQINENGKELAFYNLIPEMNHNEIVGWANGPRSIFTVLLRSNLEFERNSSRLAFTENVIRSKTDAVQSIQLKGNNLVEQTLYAIHLVDWISFFIAEKKGIDVTEVRVIDALKARLAN